MKTALAGLFMFIFAASLAAAEKVELKRQGNRVDVLIGGKAYTTYYFDAKAAKPYMYPLESASGIVVTRGFPMRRDIPGESTDHPHHRGLYFAHGDINGNDFWSEQEFEEKAPVHVGDKTYQASEHLPWGRTVLTKLILARGGKDSGLLKAAFHLVDSKGTVIGDETQSYTFSGDATTRTIDCEFVVRPVGGPLKFGDTKEGTFAIRLVKALEEPNGKMTDSEGRVGEKQIWGKRANWVDFSGTVSGKLLGIAIFDNPSNPKHPTYWHARGYGLFAVNPFGEHDFYNDPKRDGSVTIPVGESLAFRYRVLIHEGDAASAKVADAYANYAGGK